MDGTNVQIELTAEDVWEGDGSRRLSQIIKNRQMMKFKIVDTPRPILLGLVEEAAMGVGADAVTAASAATTTSGIANTAGSTTLTLSASTGLTGVGTAYLVIDPGTATEEIVAVTTPGTANAFTVTSPTTGLRFTHTAGGAVRTSTTHVLTDQTEGNYWTIEFGLGSLAGAAGITIRITDCKVESLKVSGKAGSLIMYESDWVGIASVSQASPATVTYENHNPFLYTQGVWTLNGLTTGDALAFETFDITRKNNLDSAVQTEQLTLATLNFGMLNVDMAAQMVFQNPNLLRLVYFGSTAGTTDAQALGTGTFSVTFTQPDNFHTVTYALGTLNYSKLGFPEPKKDGKAYRQTISASGTSNQAQSTVLMTTTVTNSQTTAY